MNGFEDWYWSDYLDEQKAVAAKLIKALLKDLTDRRGLGHEFEAIDDDIKKEIIDVWIAIASKFIK